MASSLVKLTTINNIQPGQSVTRSWNNATPGKAVWNVQAVPLESSFTTSGTAPQSVEAEVTRVWRKLNRTWKQSDVQPFVYEHEVWYVVKNVGAKEVDVDVYASIIS